MSLAAETREAVRARPVLYDALRAGIVNYTAAAESLGLDGDTDAVATALRRFERSLASDEADGTDRRGEEASGRDDAVTVRMESGLSRASIEGRLLAVDGVGFGATARSDADGTATGAEDSNATESGESNTAGSSEPIAGGQADPSSGPLTAIVASGGVDGGGISGGVDDDGGTNGGGASDGIVGPAGTTTLLRRLGIAGVAVEAVGVRAGRLVLVVPRRDGVTALRIVEAVLA